MIIVKIGGGKEINLEGIVKDLAELREKFLIVHGANAVRDEIAEKLGNPTKVVTSVSGYSSVLSDERAIDAIMMGYSGIQNKRLVELCQRHGINAVGLSGIDGQLVQGERNKGIRVRQGEKTILLRDYSGKPKGVNKELLELLMDHGYAPVICIPILDENRFAINTENDDIVTVLQQALHAEKIIQLIEAPGFLEDKDDEKTLIPRLSKDELQRREEQVHGRMKRKILALRKLLEDEKTIVMMSDGRSEHPIKDALAGKGTTIQ
ncbi:MAG: [LysW]-aminoadipate kinase [Deltaproteobacteria bacterium]|nr:[LysW]-aminoadipate kinase [Deltaproteobacteria bacterium]